MTELVAAMLGERWVLALDTAVLVAVALAVVVVEERYLRQLD